MNIERRLESFKECIAKANGDKDATMGYLIVTNVDFFNGLVDSGYTMEDISISLGRHNSQKSEVAKYLKLANKLKDTGII